MTIEKNPLRKKVSDLTFTTGVLSRLTYSLDTLTYNKYSPDGEVALNQRNAQRIEVILKTIDSGTEGIDSLNKTSLSMVEVAQRINNRRIEAAARKK